MKNPYDTTPRQDPAKKNAPPRPGGAKKVTEEVSASDIILQTSGDMELQNPYEMVQLCTSPSPNSQKQ